jgi:hypothetical protein
VVSASQRPLAHPMPSNANILGSERRHLAPRFRTVLAVVLGFQVSGALAKSYVATPAVDWQTLVPYVRANIVPELSGNDFHVFVCPAHTDRSVVTPFDEALGDFTRVLITQGMHTDRKLPAAIEAATEKFRRQVPLLGPGERDTYRELFWQSLSDSGDLLPRLQSLFEAARSEGRLRCWLCDKVPDYAPSARRVPEH